MGNTFYLNDDVYNRLKYYGCEKYQRSIDEMGETHDYSISLIIP